MYLLSCAGTELLNPVMLFTLLKVSFPFSGGTLRGREKEEISINLECKNLNFVFATVRQDRR